MEFRALLSCYAATKCLKFKGTLAGALEICRMVTTKIKLVAFFVRFYQFWNIFFFRFGTFNVYFRKQS